MNNNKFLTLALLLALLLFSLIPDYRLEYSFIISKLNEIILLFFIIYLVLKGIYVSDQSNILRNISILFIGNFIIYTILFFINSNTFVQYFFNYSAINFFIGYFIFSVTVSFIGSYIFYNYRLEISKKGFHRLTIWKYLIISIITNLILYAAFTKIINLFFPTTIFYPHVMNYVMVGSITILFLSLFYFLEKKKRTFEQEIIKETTKAETATAQFETLKNQLDPHFLFNSLNVLTGLIEENPEKAIDFTTALSKIYRYLLEQKDKEVVPLEDEIKFAKTYINLLKLRFENSIHFHLNLIEFNENEYIIPLSLQILLENTIKHNIATEVKPLKIRIYKENQYLVVENSFQLKETIKDSTGVGLNNIEKRYQLISKRTITISQTNEKFKVSLPILTQKINSMENPNNQEDKNYQLALERAKELKKFYTHLGTYVVFSLFFFILNAITSFGHWWFYWPILGWGLGVSMNAVKVFVYSKGWEERKAQEILDKENQSNQWR